MCNSISRPMSKLGQHFSKTRQTQYPIVATLDWSKLILYTTWCQDIPCVFKTASKEAWSCSNQYTLSKRNFDTTIYSYLIRQEKNFDKKKSRALRKKEKNQKNEPNHFLILQRLLLFVVELLFCCC